MSPATPSAAPDRAPSPESRLSRLHRWGVQNPKYYYIAPPSVWAVMVYLLSLVPLREVEPLLRPVSFPYGDKLVHFLAYALLSLLVIRGWHREKMPPIDLHAFVWLLCMVFGIMIEIQQGLTPYRSFEGLDILADGAGALMGQALWQTMMWRWGRRTRLYPGLFRGAAASRPVSRRKTTDRP